MKIGVLSDIHANLVALEAVLASLGSVDALWVCGDTVGYGPEPSDVLALLRERGAVIVAGNHDRAVATGEDLELFNEPAALAVLAHQRWLSAEERDALDGVHTDGVPAGPLRPREHAEIDASRVRRRVRVQPDELGAGRVVGRDDQERATVVRRLLRRSVIDEGDALRAHTRARAADQERGDKGELTGRTPAGRQGSAGANARAWPTGSSRSHRRNDER